MSENTKHTIEMCRFELEVCDYGHDYFAVLIVWIDGVLFRSGIIERKSNYRSEREFLSMCYSQKEYITKQIDVMFEMLEKQESDKLHWD